MHALRKLFYLLLLFSTVSVANATTYYIAASGADTNNGTAKTTPWVHAPGMPNCTATCASTTPQPGDSFIFRGGDTWHTNNSAASPYVGSGGWVWLWSGSSTNCNYESGVTTSCIYIGVDKTWFSGASWVRPALYMDNPPSKSLVASCAFPENNEPSIQIGNFATGHPNNYVIIDNFEFYGHCHDTTGQPGTSYVYRYGIYIDIINCYFHGWTLTTGANNNSALVGLYTFTLPAVTHDVFDYDIWDGSDSFCPGPGVGGCSGKAIGTDAYIIEHSIIRYISNGMQAIGYMFSAHDNLFENIYESYDINHGDVLFMYGNTGPAGSSVFFYNNIIRNTNIGQTIALTRADGTGSAIYVFNNVWYNNANASNCMVFYSDDTTSGSYWLANNTVVSPCTFGGSDGNGNPQKANGTITYQNNHLIGFGCSPISASCAGSTGGDPLLTFIDNGNDVFQTVAVANGQGYIASNNYRPSSISVATYHAGGNLSSSCSVYSSDSALCSGSTGGVTNSAGTGIQPTLSITSPPARGTTWDVGSYQFGGLAGIQVSPPISLPVL